MIRRAVAVGALVLGVACLDASSSQAASVAGSAIPSTVTFSSGTLAGLVYQGDVTVATAAGGVTAMEFTSTAADLTDLGISLPCVPVSGLGGITSVTTTASGGVSHAASGLTLYATEVVATIGGSSVDWTPANPPPGTPPAALGDAALTGVTITARLVQLPALDAPGLKQTTSFCTP